MKRQIIINGKETKVRLISLLIRHGALCGDIPHQVEDFKSNTKKELLVMVKRLNVNIEALNHYKDFLFCVGFKILYLVRNIATQSPMSYK